MYSETSIFIKNIVNTRIKPEVVKEILKNLEEREIVSIIFLMVDKNSDFSKVIQEIREDFRSAFIRLTSKNAWAGKLLESLILIGNREVVGKMGFSQQEIKTIENSFLAKQHTIICYLNKAIISLYFLCENLVDDEVKELVKHVNNKLYEPVDINDNKLYLELHILEWLKQGYISIDPGNLNLSDLINFKNSNCLLDLPFHCNDWEKHQPFTTINESDSMKNSLISKRQDINKEYSEIVNDPNFYNPQPNVMWSSLYHKKLCIIVNQMNFKNTKNTKQYPFRKGSEKDEKFLKETFNDCGFEIQIHRDLESQKMIHLLKSLNSKVNNYATYGAIFICILSHGSEDGVAFSDNKTLSLETIRREVCCRKLRNTFKFVIIQSCQGDEIGMENANKKSVRKTLVSDGPLDRRPLNRAHCGVFLATTPGFAAMRDEEEGSPFIQELCRVIKSASKLSKITDLAEKVTYVVSGIRSASPGNELEEIVQQPEMWYNTISVPYVLIPNFRKLF